MRSLVVVDLGFGDSGKGAMTEALCIKHNASLVVRYSGGCQAGHNVQTPDGKRHCFSQFGAGTLAGAKTYLGPDVIVDPFAMANEAAHLKLLGIEDPFSKITVHPSCLVTTPYHQSINLIENEVSGHGSCGMGIGATREYHLQYGSDVICHNDVWDTRPYDLTEKLSLLQKRLLRKAEGYSINSSRARDAYTILRTMSPALLAMDYLKESIKNIVLNCSRPLEKEEVVIFEGAQGVLLDQYAGFHPYTTWSDVTPAPALEMLRSWGEDPDKAEIIGVTRAYHTRHGNGPFLGMDDYIMERSGMYGIPGKYDVGNEENYQGQMRAGPLCLPFLKYAVNAVKPHSIAVSCLDHLPEKVPVIRKIMPNYSFKGGNFPDQPTWTISGQEEITKGLFFSDFPVEYTEDLLSDIQDVTGCPIHSHTNGPTYENRTWRDER